MSLGEVMEHLRASDPSTISLLFPSQAILRLDKEKYMILNIRFINDGKMVLTSTLEIFSKYF